MNKSNDGAKTTLNSWYPCIYTLIYGKCTSLYVCRLFFFFDRVSSIYDNWTFLEMFISNKRLEEATLKTYV